MSANPVAKLLIVDDEAAQMRALCNTLEHTLQFRIEVFNLFNRVT